MLVLYSKKANVISIPRYLNYCRGLRFDEAPDYMYLRQLYRILFRTLNHQVSDFALNRIYSLYSQLYSCTGLGHFTGIRAHTGPREFQSRAETVHSTISTILFSDIPDSKSQSQSGVRAIDCIGSDPTALAKKWATFVLSCLCSNFFLRACANFSSRKNVKKNFWLRAWKFSVWSPVSVKNRWINRIDTEIDIFDFQYDYTFDWTMLKQKAAQGTSGAGALGMTGNGGGQAKNNNASQNPNA